MKFKKKDVISVVLGALMILLILTIGSVTPFVSLLNPESGVVQNSKNLI
ncbi:MAG: hypothetical protein ACP5LF_05370 [Nitrososphaeria archaeon]